MFNYNYLTPTHLKGFDNYKYSAIDTSPLSRYVMHPFWNTIVKFIPNWIAPNLLTFSGFLCMVANAAILSYLDPECVAVGGPGLKQGEGGYVIPNYVYTLCGVLLFLAYNLDGVDGKQARKLGVCGPLGEIFDHGFDSYIVFLIPFCLFSVFGRDEYSIPTFRGYLVILSIVLNFYVSHWEKYITGTLYLPWGYDLSMWVSTLLFLVAGAKGPEVYKFYVYDNVTFLQVLEIAIHGTGLCTTLPIAVYNVLLSNKNGTGKQYSFMESIRPLWSILALGTVVTAWALYSPNQILEYNPRLFLLLFGTLFSFIASRLIVSGMSDQRCEGICWIIWLLTAGVAAIFYMPKIEVPILNDLVLISLAAHLHYGFNVVRQLCSHFRISCFTVPKDKRKSSY